MLAGVTLALSEVPEALAAAHGLGRRVCDRGGEREVQFLLGDAERLLPVWCEGGLRVVRWGNRRSQGRALPLTAWARLATVEAGGWLPFAPEPVVVPARLGLDNGVWYKVRQGVRALLVRDENGEPVAYPVLEPASHYYRVMTRSDWMPVLVGERI